MKQCFYIFILLAFLSSLAYTQVKKAEIFINGGISLPLTPTEFKDYWSLGYNFGGGANYIITPNIGVGASVGYSSMAFNEEGFLTDFGFGGIPGVEITVNGADVSILMATANFKYSFVPRGAVSPYVLVGVGLFNISAEDITVTVDYLGETYTETEPGPSESAFGLQGGVGVDIPVSPTVSIFLEVDYGMGFTEGESTGYLPVKGGILFML